MKLQLPRIEVPPPSPPPEAAKAGQGGGEAIPSVSVRDLLERATPYEEWQAPFDPRLRRALLLTGAALGVHFLLVLIAALLHASWPSYAGFFLVGRGFVGGLIAWLAANQGWLLPMTALALGFYGWLAWRTKGFRAGTLAHQQQAFLEILGGAGTALPTSVFLGFVVFHAVLWPVLIVLSVVVGIALSLLILGIAFAILGAALRG